MGAGIDMDDMKFLRTFCLKNEIRTVLEFGPGVSTKFFNSMGCMVTSCENEDKWYEVARTTIPKRVRLLRFQLNPVKVLGLYEKFDLAFVDAPVGNSASMARKPICEYVLDKCRFLILHDAFRHDEKQIMLEMMKHGSVEMINTPRGMGVLRLK